MKPHKSLKVVSTRLKMILKQWQEPARRVRDPEVVGSIKKIWKGQYPSQKVRKHLGIGGKENKQITFLEKFFMTLLLLRTYIDLLYCIKVVLKSITKKVKEFEKSETKLVESYVLIKSVLLFIFFCLPISRWSPTWTWVIGMFISWEILGLPVYPLTVQFVDRYRYDKSEPYPYCYWFPYSLNRTILFVLWGYIEAIIYFAYMYRHFDVVRYMDCGMPITTVWDALYFSVVTITTLGYGDIRPINLCGRILTSVEPITGITLLVLVLGLFFVKFDRRLIEDDQKK